MPMLRPDSPKTLKPQAKPETTLPHAMDGMQHAHATTTHDPLAGHVGARWVQRERARTRAGGDLMWLEAQSITSTCASLQNNASRPRTAAPTGRTEDATEKSQHAHVHSPMAVPQPYA